MNRLKLGAILILASSSFGFAGTETAEQVRDCYSLGTSDNERYACMGSSVSACLENTGSEIAICAQAEVRVWQSLIDDEVARITSILEEERIISGPCLGNDAGCLQGLRNLLSDGAEYARVRCADEASATNSAGRPEMAMAACMMRETARQAIRVRNFGEGMGQYSEY